MISLLVLTQIFALSTSQIVEKMDAVERGRDATGQMQMTITNSKGFSKNRRLGFARLTEDKNEKLFFEFIEPTDVRGSKFLLWSESDKDSSVWMYLPALKRTRRLVGSSRYESFMGSDFLYEDLNKRHSEKDRFESQGLGKCGNEECHILEAFPKDSLPYFKRKLWVSTKHFLPLRIEYYEGESLSKSQENSDVRLHNGIWTVFKTKMKNELKSSETLIEFNDLKYNQKLSEKDFAPSRLQ